VAAAAVLATVASLPILAGESKRCTAPIQECLNYMSEKMRNSGFVGVEIDIDEETGTYTVQSVIPGTPAEEAGIMPGDQLYGLNGVRIIKGNEKALKQAHREWTPGQSVTYTIRRDGADREITLTLARMPADVMAKWIGKHMLEHAEVPEP
jgi:C-terminal processing protease CtpA/Prc